MSFFGFESAGESSTALATCVTCPSTIMSIAHAYSFMRNQKSNDERNLVRVLIVCTQTISCDIPDTWYYVYIRREDACSIVVNWYDLQMKQTAMDDNDDEEEEKVEEAWKTLLRMHQGLYAYGVTTAKSETCHERGTAVLVQLHHNSTSSAGSHGVLVFCAEQLPDGWSYGGITVIHKCIISIPYNI